jgi:hypothetical protein
MRGNPRLHIRNYLIMANAFVDEKIFILKGLLYFTVARGVLVRANFLAQSRTQFAASLTTVTIWWHLLEAWQTVVPARRRPHNQ